MVEQLGGERRQFTLDFSTADGRVAASKEYSGRVDADKVVREIRDYYRTGELAQESELARFRYQLAEQASRDAKRNEQQQASRVIAEKAAALDTLSQFFGLTKGVNVSRSAVDELAGRWAEGQRQQGGPGKAGRRDRSAGELPEGGRRGHGEGRGAGGDAGRERSRTGQCTATASCGTSTRNCTSWSTP